MFFWKLCTLLAGLDSANSSLILNAIYRWDRKQFKFELNYESFQHFVHPLKLSQSSANDQKGFCNYFIKEKFNISRLICKFIV